MACKLIDAQAMHRKHPKTFWVPSKQQLDAVKVGDHVKVACRGVRFWVKVDKVTKGGFCGKPDEAMAGKRICPKRRHIYNTMKG